MNLVGLLAVRNEDWVIGASARIALKWCDQLVILNHQSTDLTAAIVLNLITEFPGRVHIIHAVGAWKEMQHRQDMLECARRLNATHVAIVDADEILTANLVGKIRDHIGSLTPGWMLQLPGYNLRGGLDRYHANGIWGNRWFATAFADDPRLGWKGDRFHHREPEGAPLSPTRSVMQGAGGIMHLWGASERRLIAKHALYKMTEAIMWPEKSRTEIDVMYSQAIYPAANRGWDQNWQYAAVPDAWWAGYEELREHIHVDAAPWQEKECRLLLKQYGPERFAGLDLFGVCETAMVAR